MKRVPKKHPEPLIPARSPCLHPFIRPDPALRATASKPGHYNAQVSSVEVDATGRLVVTLSPVESSNG